MISEALLIDRMEGMARFPDGFIDLLVDDIPYGIGVGKMAYLTEAKKTVRQKNGSRIVVSGGMYARKEWDLKSPPQGYFDEVRRVSKHQIIFGVDYVDWKGLGPGRIKWNKGIPEKVSFKSYERAYCSLIDHEMQLDLLWNGMMQAKSLEEPMRQQGNKKLNEKRVHPTQKPRLLYRKIYQLFTTPGMKILDNHMGSQNSRIEAWLSGLDYYGHDIDQEYYEVGCRRFEEATGQKH